MKLGMTGNRDGFTDKCKERLIYFLNNTKIDEVHHGDCLGSDQQFHEIITERSELIKIIIHPPKINTMRAFCKSDNILPVKDYLERNRDIVNNTELLLAFPSSDKEVLRSGTWSTIRYAQKMNKKVLIFLPDGRII